MDAKVSQHGVPDAISAHASLVYHAAAEWVPNTEQACIRVGFRKVKLGKA